MRILMILIPDSESDGGGDPAVMLEHAAGPYFAFQDHGAEVVLASPNGGAPAIEFPDHSTGPTAITHRFRHDRSAIDAFSDTLSLDQIFTDDFDAAFCVGVPGPIWRAEQRHSAGALIAMLLDAGKPVAVMPSGVDLAPKGAGEGLLIVGDSSTSLLPIAQALMGAVVHLQSERKTS